MGIYVCMSVQCLKTKDLVMSQRKKERKKERERERDTGSLITQEPAGFHRADFPCFERHPC